MPPDPPPPPKVLKHINYSQGFFSQPFPDSHTLIIENEVKSNLAKFVADVIKNLSKQLPNTVNYAKCVLSDVTTLILYQYSTFSALYS